MNHFIEFKNILRTIRKSYEERVQELEGKKQDLESKLDNNKYKIYLKTKGLFYSYFKEIEASLESIKKEINAIKDLINIIIQLIRTYDNEKAIGTINNPGMLLYIIKVAVDNDLINTETASVILGSSFVFDATHYKNNSNNKPSEQLCLEKIACYYNIDGTFRSIGSSGRLESLYMELCNRALESNPFESANYNSLLKYKQFIGEIKRLYENTKIEKMPVARVAKENIVKDYNPRLKELKKYYKNGKLIKIPSDLQEFELLLIDCGIDIQEKRYIYKLVEEALNSSRVIEVPVSNEIEMPVAESNNLVFLTDPDGNRYFDLDLATISKAGKKRAAKTLAKIKPNLRSHFRRVYCRVDTNFEMYEVINCDIHIIFVELDAGIYLVLGIAPTGKNYEVISRRYFAPQNKEHIIEIKKCLKNDEEREKLLDDNAIVFADDLSLTRGKYYA